MSFVALLILLLLLFWLVQAFRFVLSREKSWWRIGLKLVASSCLVIGALGFFGSALSSAGALKCLPDSFEWPSNGSDNSLRLSDGEYAVPHTGSGRVQIYDEELTFIRGWTINASGGVFVLAPSQRATFYVITARNDRKFEYDVLGNQVSSAPFGGAYPPEHAAHVSIKLDVNPLLWPFTSPFAAWLFAGIGIALVVLLEKMKAKEQ